MEISDIVKKQRAYFATGATRDVDKRIAILRDKRLFVSEKTIAACFQQKAQYIVISPLRYTTFSIRVCTRS